MKPDGTPAGRRRIGGDVFLTPLARVDDAAGAVYRIDIGFAVPDWRPHREATTTRAAFPGTAIEIDGAWYEIIGIDRGRSVVLRVAYDLRPWDDTAVLRHTFALTPEACLALTRKHREQQRRRHLGQTLKWAAPFIGLLPAEDQQRLEREYGLPAALCTSISAGILLFICVLALMAAIALGRGMHFGVLHELFKTLKQYRLLTLYLAVESIVRLGAVSANQPTGSLPVVLVVTALRTLRNAVMPSSSPGTPRAHHSADHMFKARDQVRPLDDGRLEILSRLPKDHWTANVTGIEVDGETYILTEREVVKTSKGSRHRFVLEKPEHDALFSQYQRYRPEEVRDVYREQERVKTAMWVESFPFLWGLLDQDIQSRLAALYSYDAFKWSRWTSFGVGFIGGGAVISTFAAMFAGMGTPKDGMWFLIGTCLAIESWLRWSKMNEGAIRGSLLGLPFRPLAVRLLRWE